MSSPISGTHGTKKGFLDRSRPRQMEDADKIYQRLSFRTGDKAADAMAFATTLSDAITSTKGFELDQLWEKIEKKLNGNKSLPVKAKDDVGKAQTAYSLFYNVLDNIDQKATTSIELQVVKDLFAGVELHVANKWLANVSPQEKRVLERIAKTINGRIDDISERFNAAIEAGTMAGRPV